MSSSKSDDTYDIPVSVLKLSKYVIAPILSKLFNQCIELGIYPSTLKIAKVIPIFKDGDKTCDSKYRPISILPHFSKIFEKLLQLDLIKFLKKCNVISSCQYGFQEIKSTTDALVELCNHLNNQQVLNKITHGVFIDLKKTFDTVNHDILRNKLLHSSIRGIPFKLFSDYLSNRHQFTCINTSKSNSYVSNHWCTSR